jgi:hypothetical protein
MGVGESLIIFIFEKAKMKYILTKIISATQGVSRRLNKITKHQYDGKQQKLSDTQASKWA